MLKVGSRQVRGDVMIGERQCEVFNFPVVRLCASMKFLFLEQTLDPGTEP